jgi:hypothetical protein
MMNSKYENVSLYVLQATSSFPPSLSLFYIACAEREREREEKRE